MSLDSSKNETNTSDSYILGAWTVTPSLNTLTLNPPYAPLEKRKLSPKVMALCELLVAHHKQPLSQEVIAHTIWPNRVISDSSIYQAIAQLRKALSHPDHDIEYIERISGKGYRITADIKETKSVVSTNKQKSNINNKQLRPSTKKWLLGLITLLLLVVSGGAIKQFSTNRLNDSVKQIPVLPASVAIYPTKNLSSPHNESFNSFSQLLLGDLLTDSAHYFTYVRIANAKHTELTQLTSSIFQDKNSLVAHLELTESQSGKVMWARSFSVPIGEYLQLKNLAVAGLKQYLAPHSKPASIVQAKDKHFEDYALAQYLWDKRDPQSLQKAQAIYQDILANSPTHVDALIGQCHTLLYLSVYSDLAPEQAHQQCQEPVSKAIQLAPNNGKVLATQALLMFNTNEPDEAAIIELFKQAITATPNYALAYHWYGNFLRKIGQYQQGLTQHKNAYGLDPLSPIIIRGLAYGYLNIRRLDRARHYYQRALTIEPQYAHRSVEELDFFLLNQQRATAFLTWLEAPANIANKSEYQLTQALVWLGLGNIDNAKKLIKKADKSTTNYDFLLYSQGALASAEGNNQLALEKMKQRLALTPDLPRYAMPYIAALAHNNQPQLALEAMQKYFPDISLNGKITTLNSGQYLTLITLYQQLNRPVMANNLKQKMTHFIQQSNSNLSASHRIYWHFIQREFHQVKALIEQRYQQGWLPDYNDNIFAKQDLHNMYLASGGSRDDWQQLQ